MLVSIGCLDEDGFLVTFGGGKCTIQDGNKEVVGVIQKTATRVYKVEHEDMAGVAYLGQFSPSYGTHIVREPNDSFGNQTGRTSDSSKTTEAKRHGS